MQVNSAVGGLVFWRQSMENDGCIQICPKSWLWRLCVHTSVCDIHTYKQQHTMKIIQNIIEIGQQMLSPSESIWFSWYGKWVQQLKVSSTAYKFEKDPQSIHKIQILCVNHRWSWIASNPMTGTVLEINCMTLALFSYHSWNPESGWSQLPLQHPFSKSNSSLGYFGTEICSDSLKQRYLTYNDIIM